VRLVCFIIRIYHDARSSECQILHKVVGLIAVTALCVILLAEFKDTYVRHVSAVQEKWQWLDVARQTALSLSHFSNTDTSCYSVLFCKCSIFFSSQSREHTVETKPADWRGRLVSNIRQITSVFDIGGFRSHGKFKAIAYYANEWQPTNWGEKGRP
jgi:hypothetical protein